MNKSRVTRYPASPDETPTSQARFTFPDRRSPRGSASLTLAVGLVLVLSGIGLLPVPVFAADPAKSFPSAKQLEDMPAWARKLASPPEPSRWKGLYGIEDGKPGETWTAWLSGRGKGQGISWDFMVSAGRKQGEWTRITVPSCWDMEGFGSLSYGWDKNSEVGTYRTRFVLPPSWKDRRIDLVFDGVMTDCRVSLNGKPAGEVHQGSFYRFRRSIDGLILAGQENLLEVTVFKQSSDPTVNKAERQADYWVFGGIFRPVRLEALLRTAILDLEVEAQADGGLKTVVRTGGLENGKYGLRFNLLDRTGKPAVPAWTVSCPAGSTGVTTEARIPGPELWTAETPVLYTLVAELVEGGRVLHRRQVRTGFRTIEVRPDEGIFLNGTKVWFKGTNRHAFHPDSGRTLDAAIDWADIRLMKDMNLNAVRMSHYPPDEAFLDLCDEAGLYVIDELAGWQGAYASAPGRILVREMLERDRNHPSILFWSNGNEGGWNTDLDQDFADLDLQKRPLLHPWAYFQDIDTDHYENHESTANKVDWHIFMPTEFLHGLYDGGAGSGLDDYWKLMGNPDMASSSGGFLWSWVDEGVNTGSLRLDTAGNAAPDGIVGPYREREASWYTTRDIFSPLQFEDDEALAKDFIARFDGSLRVANRWQFTSLDQTEIRWELRDYPDPAGLKTPRAPSLAGTLKEPGADWMAGPGGSIAATGSLKGPGIPPMSSGLLSLPLPKDWKDHDVLRLTVLKEGRTLMTRTWQLRDQAGFARELLTRLGAPTSPERTDPPVLAEVPLASEGALKLEKDQTVLEFSPADGTLVRVESNGILIPLTRGPLTLPADSTLVKVRRSTDKDGAVIEFAYEGSLETVRWTLGKAGRADLEYRYRASGSREYMGVHFSLPEKSVKDMVFLADGPQRVYRNRMRGPEFGWWSKDAKSDRQGWDYPEFRGFYSRPAYVRLSGEDWSLGMVFHDRGMFFRIFNVVSPADAKYAFVNPLRGSDLSFLDGIPAMGDKFLKPADMGPQGKPYEGDASYSRKVSFLFGKTGK